MTSAIQQAKDLAIQYHKGQFRKFSGEPYSVHPLKVSQIVLKYKESKEIESLMIAALLHDTVEDTSLSLDTIKFEFGSLVASLVEELTTDDKVTKSEKKAYLAKKLKTMSSWALVIKLADRLDNVSDLRHTDKTFRQSYIKETRYIISQLVESTNLSMTHLQLIHEILKEVNGVAKLDLLEV